MDPTRESKAAMTSTHERPYTTTILVENIHCHSCETAVHEALEDFKPSIHDVQVNVLRQEIRILHLATLEVLTVCAALRNAAFEVHSLLTMDLDEKVQIREIEFTHDEGWLEGLTTPQKRRVQFTGHVQVSKHVQSCQACQRENALQEEQKVVPTQNAKRKLRDPDVTSLRTLSSLDDHDGGSIASHCSQPWTEDVVPHSEVGNTIVDEEKPNVRYAALLSVGGMTCASCTSSVTAGVSELSYVESVSVTLMTNSASVVFRGKENLERLVETVEELGFECSVERCDHVDEIKRSSSEAPEERSRRTVMLRIDGMFCGHCPGRVVQAVASRYRDAVDVIRLPSLKEPIMTLSYLPELPAFTIRDIISTIDEENEAFKTDVFNPPSIEQRSQAMQRHEQRRLLKRLFVSFIAAIPTFLIGVVWMSLVPASEAVRRYFEEPSLAGAAKRSDWALFALATIVMFFAADVFHVRAYKEIRALWRKGSRVPLLRRFYRFGSMNLLLSAGTSVAYLSSVAILAINATSNPQVTDGGSTYFDSVVFLTFFILIGRWLEAYSRAKTGNAVSLLGSLRPDRVILVSSSVHGDVQEGDEKDEGSHESTSIVDPKLLEVNDIVLIPHGSSPPTDGTVIKGTTNFNESSLTGEAHAVAKVVGDTVYAGSINIGDAIQVKVRGVNGTSMLDQIISVVREGQTKRAPVERLVDTITGYFVPVITALAVTTFIVWLIIGESGGLQPRHIEPEQGGWAFWSLEFAIAVFVVACPCGIGLAAPTALFVGSGLAAKHGILVRGGGEAFQEASNIDCVVFDKTGTLTEGGDLKVTDHQMLVEGSETEAAWAIAKALEETSSHPLAQAVLRLARAQISNTEITTAAITEEPGRGVRGICTTTSGTVYEAALGSEAFITTLIPNLGDDYFTTNTLSRWKNEAKSIALLALRRIPSESLPEPWILALMSAISDPIRPSTLPALHALKERNIPTYMLTGDNPTTASAVAATLSIPQDHVFAGVLPTEKAAKIRWLQDKQQPTRSSSNPGSRKAIVAFVGDGINDAPALTAANVSISLSSATDIAMHSSSFILLSPTDPLASIPTLIDLSKRVFRRVKFNFAWAVVYNVILVPVAAGCFFWVKDGGWRLGPVWGSAAMAGSSVCVVLSSLALRLEGRWWRIGKGTKEA